MVVQHIAALPIAAQHPTTLRASDQAAVEDGALFRSSSVLGLD
jgi:hypothetical protein